MNEPAALDPTATLVADLQGALGAHRVITDEAERRFYSEDVYRTAEPVLAAIQPGTVEDLARAVGIATAAGVAVIPRGGGMSYTDGYLPSQHPAITIDTQHLNRVVEVNETDRYVVVECGCTWRDLHEALAEKGLRTPYWGPLSGIRATIGGAMSQGSIFLGSSRYGTAPESLLGLEIVTANGSLLRTGSWGAEHATPFFRNFGPDLTGLFCGDNGALGIKARAALKLLPQHSVIGHASFSFNEVGELLDAMGAIGCEGLATECFAFDPFLQAQRMKRESLSKDIKTLGKVIKSGGIRDGIKLVAGGRNFLKDVPFSMHIAVEADSSAELESRLARARELAKHGKEIDNAVPKVLRAYPFAEVNSMLGPTGERWVPVHGIVPYSQARDMQSAIASLMESRQAEMSEHTIEWGYLMSTIAHSAFLIEPVFYWRDAQLPFHKRVVEASHLAKLTDYPENLAARALVDEIRHALKDLFHEHGATHFQIGKFYHYRQGRNPASLALLDAIKRHLDPNSLMNPRALGFG